MNIRSLTRGDGAVIGAAVLLLIASFLPFFSADQCSGDNCSVNSWDPALFPGLPTIHLAGLIAAALIVGARFLPAGRKVAGLSLPQWGTALAVFAAWSALWATFSHLQYDPSGTINDKIGLGAGAWLSFLFALVLAAAAVLSGFLPALKVPLLPAPGPQQPQAPYGQPQPYPGATQSGSYGYPGAPVSTPSPSYGAQSQPAPYGAPGTQPLESQAQPQPADASDFTAFWFAVPVARPLFPEDGSPSPIAELTPGTWYLAVDQRGSVLVAQTQDGRRGVLQDTSGIQRG